MGRQNTLRGCCLKDSAPHAKSLALELLEDRRLLSGVTLIAHGFASSVDGWVAEMADAMVARRGDLDELRYVIQVTDPGHDYGPLSVVGSSLGGPALIDPQTHAPEIVVLLDWSDVAGTLPFGGHLRSTDEVAAAVHGASPVENHAAGLGIAALQGGKQHDLRILQPQHA